MDLIEEQKDRKNVLIIDDSLEVRRLFKVAIQLKFKDVNIIEAENAIKALEMLKVVMPDIILLDLLMPNMDGEEFLNQIRAQKKFDFVPIIICSALNKGDEQEKFIKKYGMSFQGYLMKPFKPEVLLNKIEPFITGSFYKKLSNKIIDMYLNYRGEGSYFFEPCNRDHYITFVKIYGQGLVDDGLFTIVLAGDLRSRKYPMYSTPRLRIQSSETPLEFKFQFILEKTSDKVLKSRFLKIRIEYSVTT